MVIFKLNTWCENSEMSKNIAFFVRHFNERGTTKATFDYAFYNEKILGNRSIIIFLMKMIFV